VTLCVYAVAGRTARVSATGIDGERLQVYRHSSLAAIAGMLKRRPAASATSLRSYDETMRRLAVHMPALLPARFGTCFADREELLFVLRSRRVTLQRALAHVRNRVQMTVRVVNAPREVPARHQRVMFESGTAYLHDRADAAARDREVAGFAPIRDAVGRWLRDERIERRGRIVTVYHLIPRTSAEAYRRAAMRAAAAAGLRIIVTGPYPAYAFADNW
jgi:hypothetical protein